MEFIVLLFLANLGLSFVAASVASSKGRTAAGFFFFSFFLSFLLAIIVLIALPPIEKVNGFTNRRCPYCQEVIQAAAVVCKHCGRDIEPLPKTQIVAAEKLPKSYYAGLWLTILGALGTLSNAASLIRDEALEYTPIVLGGFIVLLIAGVVLLARFRSGKSSKTNSDKSA
jgi:drug/metabolite transporter (DMT)-like permease